jgi:hypothetical protein
MGRIARRRQNYQAGKAGATHASQEKQDDGVTQGTSPEGNHQDADGNLDIHARNDHDNDDNADCAENDNSNIAATTNGDNRPDVHGHEGEDVYVGGPVLKLAKIKFAPNAIFRVVSCLYILYDLTYSFLWRNSNHSLSYKVYRCFTVFFTSD